MVKGDSSQVARRLAKIIEKKLGEDVVILDLREASPLADFFVIATASSTVHARAIADGLCDPRLLKGLKMPHHIEGWESGQWILLDYFDVIVHIFLAETREFYGLERLWGDVPRRRISQDKKEV
ncbi:MAG: ribosome silencing factor [candidate division WOR-3 bacterium]